MKIEVTPDKVVIDYATLMQLVKDAVEKQTGRKVAGDINFNKSERAGVVTAYCHLKPASLLNSAD